MFLPDSDCAPMRAGWKCSGQGGPPKCMGKVGRVGWWGEGNRRWSVGRYLGFAQLGAAARSGMEAPTWSRPQHGRNQKMLTETKMEQ